MIIYNVTCNIEQDIAEEWLHWMRTEHIPEVMSTGVFTKYRMVKVLENQPGDHGQNYSIQYHAESHSHLQEYQDKHAPLLRQKTLEKYGEKVMAFRTILKILVD